MRRRVIIAAALVAGLLSVTLFAQGPASAQIQAALRAFLTQAHTWTGVQTFTGSVVGGAGGSTTQVQYNATGSLAGDAGLTYVAGTDTLSAGNIVVAGTCTGCGSGASSEATVTTTGNITALSSSTTVVRMNNATLATIQGIAAGVAGQTIQLISVGAGQVDLAHQNGSAPAANQLINFATSAATSLAAGSGTATLVYDATTARWRLVDHEQGTWITPTFAAGNYTAGGSQTWTVDSGDVIVCRYWLKGRTLSLQIRVDTASVGGTPAPDLQRVIPGGYAFALGTSPIYLTEVRDNNTYRTGLMQVSSVLFFYPTSAAGPATTTWQGAVNTNGVNYTGEIEVS